MQLLVKLTAATQCARAETLYGVSHLPCHYCYNSCQCK